VLLSHFAVVMVWDVAAGRLLHALCALDAGAMLVVYGVVIFAGLRV
jgi:hypothetical protein